MIKTPRKNGSKCMNILKKSYPQYIFGLSNGRPMYKKQLTSRWRALAPRMLSICDKRSAKRRTSRNRPKRRSTKTNSKRKYRLLVVTSVKQQAEKV